MFLGGGGGYGGRGGNSENWMVNESYNAAAARGVMAPYFAAAYTHPNSAYGSHGNTNWTNGGDDAWD